MISLRGLAALALAAGTLSAQSWDASFRLVGGHANQAAADGAGSPYLAGLSMEGATPLPSHLGTLVLEGGYRKFVNTTAKDPAIPDPLSPPAAGSATYTGTDLESNSQGWIVSALWRREIGRWGFYAEGGLRWSSFTSRETYIHRSVTIDSTGATAETRNQVAASFDHRAFGPLLGIGFRFDASTSADIRVSRQAVPTADGAFRNLTVLELGLGTHF